MFETIDELKQRIANALSKALSGAATSVFINETVAELDEISGKYETGAILIDDPEILSLDADKICCRFTGTVSVTLTAGGKRDAVDFNENFPFECTTAALVTAPEDFKLDDTTVEIDTSSWRSDG